MEPRVSLLPVEDEKVDAIESRDRHDDPDEDVVVELAVLVDMNDEAVELRPKLGKHIHTTGRRRTYASLSLVRTFSELDVEDASPAGPQYVA